MTDALLIRLYHVYKSDLRDAVEEEDGARSTRLHSRAPSSLASAQRHAQKPKIDKGTKYKH